MTSISPSSTLLFGPPGSGKTYSAISFLKAGVSVFSLITEPGGAEVLLDAVRREKLPIDNLHWAYCPPSSNSMTGLTEMAKMINMSSYQDLANMKSGIAKTQSNQIMKLLHNLEDFKCERTGKSFGSPFSWGPDRALVLDSLSGLNILCLDNTVGQKPTPAQGEWGVAMNLEEKLILKLTSDLNCFFVLIAHADRNVEEASAMTRLTPSALGNKLSPKIGRFFSEVVLTSRDRQNNFTWATNHDMADLKYRALPPGEKLQPSFVPLVEAHRLRMAAAQTGVAA